MSRPFSKRSRLIKHAVVTATLCGGLLVSQHASAQSAAQATAQDPAKGGFNAAKQAAQETQNPQTTQNQGQVGGQIQAGGQATTPGALQGQPQSTIPGQIQPGATLQPGAPAIGSQPAPGQPGLAQRGGQPAGQQGPHLGIQVEPAEEGLRVVDVRDQSVANKAGLKQGDIITRFNGQAVRDAQSLQSQVNRVQPGQEAELVVMREDEEEKLTAKFEMGEDRYSAARPALDDSIRAELESLRNEVKQLREELNSMKQSQQAGQSNQGQASPAQPDAAQPGQPGSTQPDAAQPE